MATDKSTSLTNSLAEPRVASRLVGKLVSVADTVAVADGAANDYALVNIRIPVDAIVRSVRIASDDLGGSAVMDVGLYKQDTPPTGTTFTAVLGTAFKTGLDVSGAAVAMTDVRFASLNITSVNSPAWVLAGLSAKPAYGEFVLGFKFTAETATAGDVTAIVDLVL